MHLKWPSRMNTLLTFKVFFVLWLPLLSVVGSITRSWCDHDHNCKCTRLLLYGIRRAHGCTHVNDCEAAGKEEQKSQFLFTLKKQPNKTGNNKRNPNGTMLLSHNSFLLLTNFMSTNDEVISSSSKYINTDVHAVFLFTYDFWNFFGES